MSPAPGMQFGPYELLGKIGAGGMGEVWRARDPRLNREVAIKTSQAKFSERFAREARVIAALNHPHICQIYDVGPDYLVMELVEGGPVKGPMPLDKALPLAIQLASAIEAAHRKNITHRDLKPANIFNTKSGIKVLDFGLAKVGPTKQFGPEDATAMPLTQEGTIAGTPQYMAPEQLQGQEVDGRADIFAFGCVLHEMLTGRRAFEGASTASVIAAILERDAPSVADVAPASLDRVLKRCLAKDPDDRWQTARDLKDELEWIASGGGAATPAKAKRLPWFWIGVCAVLLFALAAVSLRLFRQAPPGASAVARVTILAPEKTILGNDPALSPDGRLLVFDATPEDGRSQLYLRRLDALEAQPLKSTEGASYPFWSPDSRSVGFAADGKLKRIDASGGAVTTLADAPVFRGGAWSADGTILFAPSTTGALKKVAAAGGNVTDATSLQTSPGATSHRWPWFLPDGRHFLYVAFKAAVSEGEIRIGSLNGGEGVLASRVLARANSKAAYSQGYLLYARDETLVARAFDAGRFEISREAVPVVEHIAAVAPTLHATFSFASIGALVYRGGAASGQSLVWFDRSGSEPALWESRGICFARSFRPIGSWRRCQSPNAAIRTSGSTILRAAGQNASPSTRRRNPTRSGRRTGRRSYSFHTAGATMISTAGR
jgi:hypothetical protein